MKELNKQGKADADVIVRNVGAPPPANPTTMNALVDAEVSILNSRLVGSFLFRKDNGFSLIIAPCSKPIEKKEISLNELLQQGTKQGLDTTALKDLVAPDQINSVHFNLDMAFLYVNKEKDMSTQIEYAFQVSASTGEQSLIPDGVRKFFDVKKVSLAIWNTDNPGVLSKMDLKTPEQILKDLENQQQ